MAVPVTPGGHTLGAVQRPLFDHPHIALLNPTLKDLVALPTSVDNSYFTGHVLDQGPQGSCTGNAHALLFGAVQMKNKQTPFNPGSRSFNYWFARKREGGQEEDTGANPQDNLASLTTEGLCAESDMPYNPNVFNLAPNSKQVFDAKHHRLTGAVLIALDVYHLKSALVSLVGFCIGITVYPSFENAPNGDVPMPGIHEKLLGGHNIYLDGYRDNPKQPGGGVFVGQNSWGLAWGNQGRLTIPYAYLTNPSLAFTATSGSGVKL